VDAGAKVNGYVSFRFLDQPEGLFEERVFHFYARGKIIYKMP